LFIDTRIQEDVRAALRRDPRIKRPELIAVSVDGIGTVVLRGAVGSLPERLAVAHDAGHVEGVFDVIVDDVKVHPPVAHRRPDDEIRAAALQRLTADVRIRSTHIHVKVCAAT
jgi:BON domain